MNEPSVSLIITTYNWPKALHCVMMAVSQQTKLPNQFEVIIADDGSTHETKQCIANWQQQCDFPIYHVWQPDQGFRAAGIRNKAVKHAKHDYIIFIDGDSMPGRHFIHRHLSLAEKGWFVAGNRVLLNAEFTKLIVEKPAWLQQMTGINWMQLWRQKKINRLWPTLLLPLGRLRKLAKKSWHGAKTCNLAVWREDVLAINGFDESYEGWGFEDSDLVVRLINFGVYKKAGRFSVPVFHLYHQEASRKNEARNLQVLQSAISSNKTQAEKGIVERA